MDGGSEPEDVVFSMDGAGVGAAESGGAEAAPEDVHCSMDGSELDAMSQVLTPLLASHHTQCICLALLVSSGAAVSSWLI